MTTTDRWLAASLFTLAVALAVNSMLGPLLADLVSYPFSETLRNQTIGLEAVSLVLVAPWCIAAAWLLRRRRHLGRVLAIPPSAYAAYMFVQYVVGPEYTTYRPIVLLHLAIFVLSGAALVLAWAGIPAAALPDVPRRRERYAGVGVLLLAAFAVAQYVPLVGKFLTGAQLAPEALADPTMFWSIFFLDLGVVVPVTLAVGIGLLRGRDWARKPAYGVVGWFVLVPVSVSAMGIAMWVNGDPHAALGRVVVLGVAAVLFTGFAGWFYRPLFGRGRPGESARRREGLEGSGAT